MFKDIKKDLEILSSPAKASILQRFFKTWVWEYGEWDIFIGITVPELARLAKKYRDISLADLEKLITSSIHEERFLALRIIRYNFEKAKDLEKKKELFEFSAKYISYINNWDLVDTFIPYVWGEYFFDKPRDYLYTLTSSPIVWERRIAIMTTFYFLRNKDFSDTIAISKILLQDSHDLIQKAVGWMLREMWKRELSLLLDFLEQYHKTMPRTMLRYALEKLSNEQKTYFMKK